MAASDPLQAAAICHDGAAASAQGQADQTDPAHAPVPAIWGRVIFWVADVDVMHARARAHGYEPEMAPADAPWGERYFHVLDPDGHELSFARLL
jgi:uncharacterized glyoxalase superfamily protein PhnB